MNIKRLVLVTLSIILALAMLLLSSTIVAALKPITSDFANNSLGGNQSTNIYFPIIMKQNIGTEAAPIKMLFVLPGNSVILNQAGEQIEQDLHQLTGLFFEVSEPPTYKATIEIMCASPNDTIGFIPSVGYVLANQLCGVEPGLASVLFGWNVFWSEFLVARESEFQSLEDLDGASWAYSSTGSTSSYKYPIAILDDLGVTVSDTIEAGGHADVVRAVYNGQADFGTTFFSPPIPPVGDWTMGMDPDIPDVLVDTCAVEEDKLMCSGWRVMDARQTIRNEAPDVVEKVRILDISPEFPNDTMAFSPNFPKYLMQVVMDAVIEYLDSEACLQTLCSDNHINWNAAAPISDENFDGARIWVEYYNITLEDLD